MLLVGVANTLFSVVASETMFGDNGARSGLGAFVSRPLPYNVFVFQVSESKAINKTTKMIPILNFCFVSAIFYNSYSLIIATAGSPPDLSNSHEK